MNAFKSFNYFSCDDQLGLWAKKSNWSGPMCVSNFLVNIKKHMKADHRMSNAHKFLEKKRWLDERKRKGIKDFKAGP